MTSQQICKISNVSWTPSHEDILIDWADKAKCYKWMHDRSHKKYKCMNTWFTIPVIIMSTATGTANFAQYRLHDGDAKLYAPVALGLVNIFTGVLTTIQQFLKVNELNESHRVSSIGWDKFYRNIKVELSKHPEEREHVSILIKTCKEEFDRLIETSPDIDDDMIDEFIKEHTGQKRKCCGLSKKYVDPQDIANFIKMKKPDICGSLQSTSAFRHPWKLESDLEQDNGLNDVELEIMENSKIKLNAKNQVLAIEASHQVEPHALDEP
ncbi:MAG: SLATT domain-containing protein [Candidatus Thorarchaeota archaeon]